MPSTARPAREYRGGVGAHPSCLVSMSRIGPHCPHGDATPWLRARERTGRVLRTGPGMPPRSSVSALQTACPPIVSVTIPQRHAWLCVSPRSMAHILGVQWGIPPPRPSTVSHAPRVTALRSAGGTDDKVKQMPFLLRR